MRRVYTLVYTIRKQTNSEDGGSGPAPAAETETDTRPMTHRTPMRTRMAMTKTPSLSTLAGAPACRARMVPQSDKALPAAVRAV